MKLPKLAYAALYGYYNLLVRILQALFAKAKTEQFFYFLAQLCADGGIIFSNQENIIDRVLEKGNNNTSGA